MQRCRAIKGCSITVKQKTALCQGKGRGLSFNLRVYIQLQFLDKFRGFRSKQGLHIQSGHCRSDNPVLTADTYCRQPRFPPQTYQWQSCCHQKFQFHTSGIHVKLTRNQSIHKKPPFCRMLDHPKIFECFSDRFLFFRWALWLSGILGLRQIVILANFNPTFPLNL